MYFSKADTTLAVLVCVCLYIFVYFSKADRNFYKCPHHHQNNKCLWKLQDAADSFTADFTYYMKMTATSKIGEVHSQTQKFKTEFLGIFVACLLY